MDKDALILSFLQQLMPLIVLLLTALVGVAVAKLNAIKRQIDQGQQQRREATATILETVKNGPANALLRPVYEAEKAHVTERAVLPLYEGKATTDDTETAREGNSLLTSSAIRNGEGNIVIRTNHSAPSDSGGVSDR